MADDGPQEIFHQCVSRRLAEDDGPGLPGLDSVGELWPGPSLDGEVPSPAPDGSPTLRGSVEDVPERSPEDEGTRGDSVTIGFGPSNVGFFELPLRRWLGTGPYAMAVWSGRVNLRALARDHQDSLFRLAIDGELGRKGTNSALILRFGDDAAVWAMEDWLRVYARSRAIMEYWRRLLRRYVRPRRSRPRQPTFQLICAGEMGIESREVTLSGRCRLSDAALALHYGETFVAFNRSFLTALRDERGGLSILRGPPGTGKTSYLRHLIAALRRTHVFYFLTSNEIPLLASPGMVAFWARVGAECAPRRVVVLVEDADEALMRRGPDNRSQVGTLLNVADGLLGDFLKMQLVVTANCPLGEIDEALLRPGRLLALKHFRLLRRDEAERLAASIGGEVPPGEACSLAQIYRRSISDSEDPARPCGVGFGLGD